MKNDDVMTGLALAGLAFAAFQFMKPRTTATAAAPGQMRANGSSSNARNWAQLTGALGDLGASLYNGAGVQGTVQGVFAPGDNALTVDRFDAGSGPLAQAEQPGFSLNTVGSDNGAYTFGSAVQIDPTQYGY